jgi:hypothetical protein
MAYTFLQLQDEVLAYGFSATAYRARVQRWLNEAQHAAIRRVPDRDNLTSSTTSTISGTVAYSLPSDFARLESVVRTVDRAPLHPISIDWMDTLSAASGTPQLYALDDQGLNLYPTPDGVYALKLRYWKDPVDMAGDTDVPSLPAAHQDILVSYAVSRAFRAEDDQERAVAFMQDFERGITEMAADRRGEVNDGNRQVPGMWSQRHTNTGGFR